MPPTPDPFRKLHMKPPSGLPLPATPNESRPTVFDATYAPSPTKAALHAGLSRASRPQTTSAARRSQRRGHHAHRLRRSLTHTITTTTVRARLAPALLNPRPVYG
jgi:hypothetical protein